MRVATSVAMPDPRILFRDVLVDHYRSPRHCHALASANAAFEARSRVCGDLVRVELEIVDGRVSRVAALTKGCMIAVASSSLAAEAVLGLTTTEASALCRRAISSLENRAEPPGLPDVLKPIEPVREFPVRIGCATLGLRSFEAALASWGNAHQAPSPDASKATTE